MTTPFCGLTFETNENVLIPRPETEILVNRCLELMRGVKNPKILDIGTGSGNIAVSLTNSDETCKIVALDMSEEALVIACENARQLGVSDRISFIESDLFTNIFKEDGFDIIVSNPPYIPTWEIATLAGHVKAEPRLALDGGDDGLAFYRRILEGVPGFLKVGGYLIMEMGYDQSQRIEKLLKASGGFVDIGTIKDSSNIERVIEARWINS
ncbi:MAG: peptide chain release factor N(5)-glutamine methyltransferase [Candidatus Omnitrophota bacterium]